MLTHLKLDNFKIWKSTGPMRLAPVTLLLGTNSSGKSSLIQSLLLIRQTVKGDDPNQDLNLGNPDAGDSVTLGRFRDVLCRHGGGSKVGIEFRWSPGWPSANSTIFSARYRKGPAGSAELDYLRLGRDGQGFTVQRSKPGVFRLQLAMNVKPAVKVQISAPALICLRTGCSRSARGSGRTHCGCRAATSRRVSRIIYLGPVRRLAQRDYVWNGLMPATIGDDGNKAVDALIASGMPPNGRASEATRSPLKPSCSKKRRVG